MRAIVIALAAVAVVAAAVGFRLLSAPTAPAGPSAIQLGTASVVRTDIVSHQRLSGSLGYGPVRQLAGPLGAQPGVLTGLPQPGAIISQGQALYWVDDHPAVLLYGTHPAWRRIGYGTAGADVAQLEVALRSLGFASPGGPPDTGVFSSADAAAVDRFQAATGRPRTGSVEPGAVVFEPLPVRVTAVLALPGGAFEPGAPLLSVTGTRHLVTVAIDAGRAGLVKAGDSVSVLLPDGTTTAGGHLLDVGRVAASAPGGSQSGLPAAATIEVTISLDDESKGGSLDQAPVYVSIATATHNGVLAVPVTALFAQPDGSYAVAVRSGGSRQAVRIQPGLFGDNGLVEVAGAGLKAGDPVEVPAG